jgi:hypothetical protein
MKLSNYLVILYTPYGNIENLMVCTTSSDRAAKDLAIIKWGLAICEDVLLEVYDLNELPDEWSLR